jgi:broad specificity phosphatase PhoE
MPLLYFIRHGQNRANVEHVLSHRVVDFSLTGLGVKQAQAAARWLGDRQVKTIYTSPLRRAVETAGAISKTTAAPIVVAEELREVNVGSLDGRGDADAWDLYNHTVSAWHQGELNARFPGGESLAEAYERINRFLASAMGSHTTEDIAVVGHGEIFTAVLPRLIGIDKASVMRTASITIVRRNDGNRLKCEAWDTIDHLGGVSVP